MELDLDGIFLENQNVTYDDYEYKDESETSGRLKRVFIPVLYSLPFVVGVVGNGLLLWVLALKKKQQIWSVTDTLILQLGMVDILLLVTVPFRAVQAAQDSGWTFGSPFCKVTGVLFNMNFYFWVFLLTCISLDYFLSIVHTAHLFSLRRSWLVQASCLLAALLLTIPDWVFLEAKKDSKTPDRTECTHNYERSSRRAVSHWRLASRLLYHVVGFLLPSVIQLYCYSCILLRLQRGSHGLQKQRAVRVILALVVVFFVCWTPYNIALMVDTFQSRPPVEGQQRPCLKTSLEVLSALGCLHACLGPPLYLLLCRCFRTRVWAVLRHVTVQRTEAEASLWELALGEDTAPRQPQEIEQSKQSCVEDTHV